jgi:CubicO group peptidase (beta-lactamase class C family)
MYYRNGSKQYYWGKVHEQTSGAKSVTSLLIGIALQEGFLDNVNQTLYEFFADRWSPSLANSTLKKNITIEQLLTHNSGLVTGGPLYPPGDLGSTKEDMIGFALGLPLIFNPGQEGAFDYSSDGPNLLSGIITNVTGNSMEEFAKEYLFEPLQIPEDEYLFLHDNQNVSFGGYFFQCSPRVQAKLGILCLNNGSWEGEQIVDLNYFKNATTDQTGYGYGYLWWMTDAPFGGYQAAGFGGQSIYVIPEYDIVVGFTAFDGGPYEQMISDYILQFVEPAIPDDPAIPGFDLNMIFLTVFCAAVIILIRSKKNSKK